MQEKKYQELIARRLSGDISDEDQRELDDWLKQSKTNQREYELYNSLWSGTKIKKTSRNADNIFSGISAAIQEDKDLSLESQWSTKSRSISYFLRGIAASAIFFVIAFFAIQKWGFIQEPNIAIKEIFIEKSLPIGQKMKIFLPDGSTVWLNAESTISYPERFNDSLRTITLKGEAFFDVTKDTLKPFIVHTEYFDVRVVGTSFNIKNYPKEATTDVSLESGKVWVNTFDANQAGDILLTPGEGLELNKKSGTVDKYHVDPKLAFHWKDGVIYFKKADFQEVVNKLTRWYGVEIEVVNYPGGKWEYSAEFKNDNLSTVLQSMSFTKGFNYEIDQNKVKIIFN